MEHTKPTKNLTVPNNITSLSQLSNTHGWTVFDNCEVLYSSLPLYNGGNIDFEHTPNTDFFLGNNNDSIAIVVGESWTYGELIRYHKDFYESEESFEHALHNTIGAVFAKHLKSDLHQYAWPGMSNAYYFDRLFELVETYKSKYKKIYVLVCITEHFREEIGFVQPKHLSYNFFSKDHKNKTVLQFLEEYEKIYLDALDTLVSDSVHVVCWKNFTKWYSDTSVRNFTVVEKTMTDVNYNFTPLIVNTSALQRGILHSLCSLDELEQLTNDVERFINECAYPSVQHIYDYVTQHLTKKL